LAVLAAVIASIPDDVSDLEAFKEEIVRRSLREDRWQKKLPPNAEDLHNAYRELIYELCLARQARAHLPDEILCG
jgi:hypothetical protein